MLELTDNSLNSSDIKILVTSSHSPLTHYNNITFLGQWSVPDSLNAKELHQYSIAPYRWDDRSLYEEDCNYIRNFYSKILPAVSEEMNRMHNVKYPKSYWEILVGPWLYFFIQVIFERYVQLEDTIKKTEIEAIVVNELKLELYSPQTFNDFLSCVVDESWNYTIYSWLAKNFFKKVDLIYHDSYSFKGFNKKYRPRKNSILNKLLNSVGNLFNRNKDVFIEGIKLSKKDRLSLLLRYGYFCRKLDESVVNSHNRLIKHNWRIGFETENHFEKCIIELIPIKIPRAYTDFYVSNQNMSKELFDGIIFKKLFVSHVFSSEVLKFFLANQKTHGASLNVYQHGGTYGIAKWFSNFDHEYSISDKFFSWGWDSSDYPKVIKGTAVNHNPYRTFKEPNNIRILLTLGSGLKHSYKLWSEPVSSQWNEYFQQQLSLLGKLPKQIRERVLIRTYPQDLGWNERDLLESTFPEVELAKMNLSISSISKISSLVITTYNGTTFLETLSSNIPSLIYLDKTLWEINDEALEAFEKLRSVGVFHDNPNSLVSILDEVCGSLINWWKEDERQDVIDDFVKTYCNNQGLNGFVKHVLENP